MQFNASLYVKKSAGGREAALQLKETVLAWVAEKEGGANPLCTPKVLATIFL